MTLLLVFLLFMISTGLLGSGSYVSWFFSVALIALIAYGKEQTPPWLNSRFTLICWILFVVMCVFIPLQFGR